MASRGKRGAVVGVGLFAAFALAGCIDPGSGFAILERDAAASDALPSDLPDHATHGLNVASSRFVAEHDGNALYLVKGEGDRVCLLVYPSESPDWMIGCGGAPQFGAGGPTGGYVVRSDSPSGAPAPDGTVEIAPNVFAHE